MSSTVQWFVAIDQQRAGPFSMNDLEGKINEGVLNAQTKVWNSTMPDWMNAAQVPEIESLRLAMTQKASSLPRWLVVINMAQKRDHEGPLSDNDIEAALLEGRITKHSLFWKEGQAQWLVLDNVPELKAVQNKLFKSMVANMPPLPGPPELPTAFAIPSLPQQSGESVFSEQPILAEGAQPAPIQNSPLPGAHGHHAELAEKLSIVFNQSRWLPTVNVFLKELETGLEAGDPMKIDCAVERIRQFLLREWQSDHAPRHPGMNQQSMDDAANALMSLVQKKEVQDRVAKFGPVYSQQAHSPSTLATRSRILLGAVSHKSFYPMISESSNERNLDGAAPT